MSSTMKPVLPPTGGQATTPNASPPKPLPPQTMPSSYAQPMSHVPQNLGIPHSTNMSGNMLPTLTGQTPPVNQQPAHLPTPSPNKTAGLPTSRPNMIPFHPNSSEEGTALPASQNAAQLMAAHREQQMAMCGKPQSNGTAPAQPETVNKIPVVPAPIEVRPEPQVQTQNHIPETAKLPTETPAQPQPTVSYSYFKIDSKTDLVVIFIKM